MKVNRYDLMNRVDVLLDLFENIAEQFGKGTRDFEEIHRLAKLRDARKEALRQQILEIIDALADKQDYCEIPKGKRSLRQGPASRAV